MDTLGFSEDHTKALALQIAQGVRDIHACHVANLDLKPSNILIDTSFDLKIADFSCAHMADEDLELGLGTQHFMAPEMIDRSLRTEDEDHRRADMWSLGVLLFVL